MGDADRLGQILDILVNNAFCTMTIEQQLASNQPMTNEQQLAYSYSWMSDHDEFSLTFTADPYA